MNMKKILIIALILLGLQDLGAKNVYDFKMKDINGTSVSLSEYTGKVILIVNVASKCGYTNQYEGLQALYQKYKDQGLVILGFPCNQFLKQEPGSDQEIAQFCKLKYDVSFPMFSKIEVNGNGASPLYKYLKNKQKGNSKDGKIEWNFTKFLIDRSGEPIARFSSKVKPEQLEEDIIKALK